MNQINVAVSGFALLTMLIVLAYITLEKGARKRVSVYFRLTVSADILMLTTAIIMWILIDSGYPAVDEDYLFLLRILESLTYIFYYSVLCFYVFYIFEVCSEYRPVPPDLYYIIVAVCLIEAVAWTVSSFNGAIISISQEGTKPGPYYLVGQLGGYVVAGAILSIILYSSRAMGLSSTAAMISFVAAPVLAVWIRGKISVSIELMPPALSLSLLITSNFIYMREVRKAYELEKKMSDERVMLMMSQMRPHFLYNVLNSIYYLCEKDPETAQKAVGDFAEYLRTNLDSVEKDRVVDFSEELSHIKRYLSLEKMRFEEELQVQYDIRAVDFRIPVLTLQPIVENAVKHGITKKEGGGTVRISSAEKRNSFVVQIEDDGVGFDVSRVFDPKNGEKDERAHIGIQSVEERLRTISHAKLLIQSREGIGTIVTITVPKSAMKDVEETNGAVGTKNH